MSARDRLWADPALVERAQSEALRLKKLSETLDATDAKEIYRTIVDVAASFAVSQIVKERGACQEIAARYGGSDAEEIADMIGARSFG